MSTAAATTAVEVTAAESPAARATAASLGASGAVALVIVLALGLPQLVTVAGALLGGSYAASLAIAADRVDVAAPLVAAGLLLTCELAFWAHELRTTAPDEPGLQGLRAAWLSALALGALVLGAGLVTLVDVARLDGLPVEALGTAAALAIALLLLRGARRQRA